MGKLFEYSFPYTLHNENLIIVDLKCVLLPAKNCKMSNVNVVSYHVWIGGALIDDKTYLTLIVRACKWKFCWDEFAKNSVFGKAVA